jgi:hypothetical protein
MSGFTPILPLYAFMALAGETLTFKPNSIQQSPSLEADSLRPGPELSHTLWASSIVTVCTRNWSLCYIL